MARSRGSPSILVPHLRQPSPALWADVALAAMLNPQRPGLYRLLPGLERLPLGGDGALVRPGSQVVG